MLRDHLSEQLDHDPHFRWRGQAVTRIENLSDIVFALALSMLVSASDVPENWTELNAHLINIIPVTLGFALLLSIWHSHFTFFRRYGVADRFIVFLNATLLLVILFIAYPLRFIFDGLFAYVLGAVNGDWSRMAKLGLIEAGHAATIMAYFTIGYTVIFILTSSMYTHAMRNADRLKLSPAERIITRRSIWRYRIEIGLGILATVCALFTFLGPFAGFLLSLNILAAAIVNLILKLPPAEENEEPSPT